VKELRRVRFNNVDGLRRQDLATAGEIWLDDLCRAPWASREAMKVGAHLVRYMAEPNPRLLRFAAIEAQIQVGRDEVKFALRLMQLYRAIEAFSFEGDEVLVALHLTSRQRLLVLETQARLEELMHARPIEPASIGSSWRPPAAEEAADTTTGTASLRHQPGSAA
jgi:hypothetical protein